MNKTHNVREFDDEIVMDELLDDLMVMMDETMMHYHFSDIL